MWKYTLSLVVVVVVALVGAFSVQPAFEAEMAEIQKMIPDETMQLLVNQLSINHASGEELMESVTKILNGVPAIKSEFERLQQVASNEAVRKEADAKEEAAKDVDSNTISDLFDQFEIVLKEMSALPESIQEKIVNEAKFERNVLQSIGSKKIPGQSDDTTDEIQVALNKNLPEDLREKLQALIKKFKDLNLNPSMKMEMAPAYMQRIQPFLGEAGMEHIRKLLV